MNLTVKSKCAIVFAMVSSAVLLASAQPATQVPEQGDGQHVIQVPEKVLKADVKNPPVLRRVHRPTVVPPPPLPSTPASMRSPSELPVIVSPASEQPKVAKTVRGGTEARMAAERERMVNEQLASSNRGITSARVLEAMREVPRHQFIPAMLMARSYEDRTLELGNGRKIAQPYAIAALAEELESKSADRVLEIGIGCGYQTAVISLIAKQVYSLESDPGIADIASVDLQRNGYTNNVFVRVGGAEQGWSEAAPFDTIVVNDPRTEIGGTLIDQLKEGGRILVLDLESAQLKRWSKFAGRLSEDAPKHLKIAR